MDMTLYMLKITTKEEGEEAKIVTKFFVTLDTAEDYAEAELLKRGDKDMVYEIIRLSSTQIGGYGEIIPKHEKVVRIRKKRGGRLQTKEDENFAYEIFIPSTRIDRQ